MTTPLAYDLAFAATVCLPAAIFAAALCAGLAVRRLLRGGTR